MDIARVHLTGRRQSVGVDAAGHTVVMDAHADSKGDDSGIRPIELVLHALAGCTSMDVMSVLEKKRQDVRDLDIFVQATQRTDEYPKIYTKIEIEYVVTGFGVDPKAVARAIELSETKYCSVRGMLRDDIDVVTSFKVVEAPAAGTPNIQWMESSAGA